MKRKAEPRASQARRFVRRGGVRRCERKRGSLARWRRDRETARDLFINELPPRCQPLLGSGSYYSGPGTSSAAQRTVNCSSRLAKGMPKDGGVVAIIPKT